jgi:hypothetical protein
MLDGWILVRGVEAIPVPVALTTWMNYLPVAAPASYERANGGGGSGCRFCFVAFTDILVIALVNFSKTG